MGKHSPEDIEALLERARSQQDRPPPWKETAKKRARPDPQADVAGYAVRPHRRTPGRRVSTFNIVLFLFGLGLGIVLYISNVITVNQRAFEVNELQAKLSKIRNTNVALQAEINKKSSLDRIGNIAREQLGLQFPGEQPAVFAVDEDRLEELKEIERRSTGQ
ncbi:MAG: FtsL-like putative cell division protein [Ignavibacteria bacterium]|nr:FtsL-like putative cell division protein [Ignavibacteria bacterium]